MGTWLYMSTIATAIINIEHTNTKLEEGNKILCQEEGYQSPVGSKIGGRGKKEVYPVITQCFNYKESEIKNAPTGDGFF